MSTTDDCSINGPYETILVNCGRCGTPLLMRLEDLMTVRTVDCAKCVFRCGKAVEPKSDTGERALKRFEHKKVEICIARGRISRACVDDGK